MFEKFHLHFNLSADEIAEVLLYLAKGIKQGIEPVELLKLASHHFERRQLALISFLTGFYNGLILSRKDPTTLPREIAFIASIVQKLGEEEEDKVRSDLATVIKQILKNYQEEGIVYG